VTAHERRRDLLAAAIDVIAERGYVAPTALIARRAGISEAYVFRLFGTKLQLVLACHEAVDRRLRMALDGAAGPGPVRERVLRAYRAALGPAERRFIVHMHSAAVDPLIAAAVRDGRDAALAQLESLLAGTSSSAEALYGELLLMNLTDVLEPVPFRHHGDADVHFPTH
jgi:AcrR family transcriptional regulator